MTDELNQRRRALAFNAVGPAVNEADCWLPLSACKAVADAVLAAVDADTGYCSHCGRGDAGPTAEDYKAALRKALVDYGEGDYDPGTGSDYSDQVEVVLSVRDAELTDTRARADQAEAGLESSRRRAALFVERIDAARNWARRNLSRDQQAGLLAALRGDQPTETS